MIDVQYPNHLIAVFLTLVFQCVEQTISTLSIYSGDIDCLMLKNGTNSLKIEHLTSSHKRRLANKMSMFALITETVNFNIMST